MNSRLHLRRAYLRSLPPLFVPARTLISPLFPFFCFPPRTNCPICKSFALTMLQQWRCVVGTVSFYPPLSAFVFLLFPLSLSFSNVSALFWRNGVLSTPFVSVICALFPRQWGWRGRVDHELLPQNTGGAARFNPACHGRANKEEIRRGGGAAQSGAACPNDSLPPSRPGAA